MYMYVLYVHLLISLGNRMKLGAGELLTAYAILTRRLPRDIQQICCSTRQDSMSPAALQHTCIYVQCIPTEIHMYMYVVCCTATDL